MTCNKQIDDKKTRLALYTKACLVFLFVELFVRLTVLLVARAHDSFPERFFALSCTKYRLDNLYLSARTTFFRSHFKTEF